MKQDFFPWGRKNCTKLSPKNFHQFFSLEKTKKNFFLKLNVKKSENNFFPGVKNLFRMKQNKTKKIKIQDFLPFICETKNFSFLFLQNWRQNYSRRKKLNSFMKHIQKYYFGEKNTFSFLFETEKNIFFRRINYIMCKVE